MSEREPILVPLLRAWHWQCPICCEHQYALPIPVTQLSTYRDDEGSIRELLGLEAWQPIPEHFTERFVAIPEHVTCSHCRRVFDCYSPDDEADDEDESDNDPDIPNELPDDL